MRHIDPKTDDWREVHLAHVESLGNRLWLRCNACGHSMTPDPREFAHQHHLDMKTPLLSIARLPLSSALASGKRHYRITEADAAFAHDVVIAIKGRPGIND